MAEAEPRRSGRATKGKHTRNIDLDPPEPITPAPRKTSAPKKTKEKRASQPPTAIEDEEKKNEENGEEAEEGKSEIIRCVCGAQDEDYEDGRMMVQCEQCEAWQHNQCLLIPNSRIPEHYFCEICKPEMHIEFLERVKNGEKPWIKKKKGRKSSGRAGRKSISKAESEKAESEIAHSAAPTQPGSPTATNDHHHHGQDSSAAVVDPSLQDHLPQPPPQQQQQQQQQQPQPQPPQEEQPLQSKPDGEDTEMADAPVSRDSTVEIQPPPSETPTTNVPDRDATEEAPSPKATPVQQYPPPKPHGTKRKNIEINTQTANVEEMRKYSIASVGSPVPPTPHSIHTPQSAKPPPTPKATAAPSRKKRRTSDATGPPPKNDKSNREKSEDVVYNTLTGKFKKTPDVEIPDNKTPVDYFRELAHAIENACHAFHINNSDGYKVKIKTIVYNVPKNNELFKALVTGAVTPDALAKMTSADMATKELKEYSEKIRTESDYQNTLSNNTLQQTGPRIRRTHKGDEFVGDEDVTMADEPADVQMTENGNGSQSPNKSRSEDPLRRTTSGDRRQPSLSVSTGGQDNLPNHARASTPTYSPTADAALDQLEWRGTVNMAFNANFEATATLVAGFDLAPVSNWTTLLPAVVDIDGRIAIDRADSYLSGHVQYSTSNAVTIVSIQPLDIFTGTVEFNKLFHYFRTKQRYGVVTKNTSLPVRDFYIIALDKEDPLPSWLTHLEPNVIPETPRSDRLILGVFVVIKKDIKPAPPKQVAAVVDEYVPPPPEMHPHPPPYGHFSTPAPTQYDPNQYQPSLAQYPTLPQVHHYVPSSSTRRFTFNAWPELVATLPELDDHQIGCINDLVAKHPEAGVNPQLLADLLRMSSTNGR